jgi:hypothetical protein
MWESGSIAPWIHIISIRYSRVVKFTPLHGHLIPGPVAPGFHLVEGWEDHRARLDVLDKWSVFCDVTNLKWIQEFYFECLNAWGWLIRRIYVAYIDETNKICCGFQQHWLSVLIRYTRKGWIPLTRRLFCTWQGIEPCNLKCAYTKFAASSPTQHSPICRVQYGTVSNIKGNKHCGTESFNRTWCVRDNWLLDLYVVTTDFHWVAADCTLQQNSNAEFDNLIAPLGFHIDGFNWRIIFICHSLLFVLDLFLAFNT